MADMPGVAVVSPARYVYDLLMETPEFIADRAAVAIARQAREPTSTPD